jgi:hypothetical protein
MARRQIKARSRAEHQSNDDIRDRSPAERMQMVWPLTQQVWAFKEAGSSEEPGSSTKADSSKKAGSAAEENSSRAEENPSRKMDSSNESGRSDADPRLSRHAVRFRRITNLKKTRPKSPLMLILQIQ